MTNSVAIAGTVFRTREFFVHDGTKLRRFRLPPMVQLALALAIGLFVSFTTFATVRYLTAPAATAISQTVPADMARLAAATEARVLELEHRQQQLAAMIAENDFDPAVLKRIATVPTGAAVGGPYEPVTKSDNSSTFKQLFTSWKKLDTLSSGAIAVPSDKPVANARFESAYGERSDPFTGGRARHMGIVVSEAGWNNGGYGNLIKVDHGRGVETRYAHLSQIVVAPGQRVKRGQMIGKMGSTGRSTGSHLHYEVRIEGRAVNPIPFMKSTDYLLAMQQGSGKSMDNHHVAQGGPKK